MRALAPLLIVVAACSQDAPAPRATREPPAPAEEPAEERVAEAPAPWPDDVLDLRASVDHFQDLAQCEASLRAQLPTEIAEVLADLSYDSVIADVCLGLDAVKAGDPRRCEALSVRSTREGCLRRVAIATGRPDDCPPARTVEGRDPLCLAWAARDPDLCHGVAASERISCLRVLGGDPDLCPDARCRGWTRRYGPLVATEREARPLPAHASITLGSEPDARSYRASNPARGVFLRQRRCDYELELELRADDRDGPSIALRATLDPATLAAESVEARLGGAGSGELLEQPRLRLTGEVARGARWRAVLTGAYRDGAEVHPVTATFAPWVRDLERVQPDCRPLPERRRRRPSRGD